MRDIPSLVRWLKRPAVVAFISVFALALVATAGSLTPSAAPGSTMHTLAEIWNSIASPSYDSSLISANANGSLIGILKSIESNSGWASGSNNIWNLNTGNVGIGTITPTTKLDVIGNASVSGNFELGGTVSSNLTPTVTNTYSLGTATNQWSNLFATNASISNNLEVSNIASVSQLYINGSPWGWPLEAPAGSITSPSYGFDNADSMGIFRSGTTMLLQSKNATPDLAGRSRLSLGDEFFSLSAARAENASANGTLQCFDESGSFPICRFDVYDGTNLGTTRFMPTQVTFGTGASMSGNFDPGSDDTYDLGSSANRWRDLYLASGSLHIGTAGDEAVIDYNVNDDYLAFKPNGTSTTLSLFDAGNATLAGNFNPTLDTTYTLGDATHRWANLFTNYASVSNNLEVSNLASVSSLTVGGLPVGAYWSRTGTNTYLTNSGDNVGIGVTNPYAKLTVRGGGVAADNLILASNSASTLSPIAGFRGYTLLSGGLGTGMGDSSTMTPMLRITNDGNLANIGAIQAGETRLTKGGTFAAKTDYATDSSPVGAALADLNRDGKTDIVTVNNSGSVSVLMNNGSGTFAAKVDYVTPSFPIGIAATDVNGDGFPDVITGNGGNDNVSVLLNKGDGTFAASVEYSTGAGSVPRGIAVADVNGDGKTDIITADSGNNKVSVLRNNGAGTFAAHVDYTTGTAPFKVAIADVSGDGKKDIVSVNTGATSVSVLRNNGDGTFAAKVDYGTQPASSPYGVAVADISGDGTPDIVTANTTANTVSVLLNNGDGTFAAQVTYGTDVLPQGVALADLNGDGLADIVAINATANDVSVLLNNGSGTFAAKVDYPTGSGAYDLALGDVNGDGKADIVAVNNGAATISVILNRVTALFYAQASTGRVGIGTLAPSAAFDITPTASYSGLLFRVASGSNERFHIDSAGNASVSGNLEVTGSVSFNNLSALSGVDNYLCLDPTTKQVTTSAAACSTSSRRFKDNIETLDHGLDWVSELRPVTFNWKDSGKPSLGFIAEEVNDVTPLLAVYQDGQVFSVNYQIMTAVLAKAIQEQQTMIDAIRAGMITDQFPLLADDTTFLDRIVRLFRDVLGIELSFGTVKVQQLCLDDICVNKEQLRQLLEQQGIQPAGTVTPSPSPSPSPDTSPTASGSTETITSPTPTPSPEGDATSGTAQENGSTGEPLPEPSSAAVPEPQTPPAETTAPDAAS